MTQPALSSDQEFLKRYERIVNDPWEFLRTCVWTQDQVDAKEPIKQFPHHLKHLELFTRLWHAKRMVLVPKSRRMTMSWTCIALYLWDTMFHEGRHNAFVSKKEDNADELIKRAKFIYDHIPEHIIPKDVLPKYTTKQCQLSFPEMNSMISGFPQGADQLRQFTFSGILGDEMAFWEYAQKFYSASAPTLEGGGRFTGISSPAPGFFQLMVQDELDGEEPEEEPQKHFPMKGIEIWENKKNLFTCFQLHYSADPKKRDPSYRKQVKNTMPLREYLQEYELVWETYEGKPVFADFHKDIHVAKNALEPELGLPLLRGWDFGLTPACVVAQIQGGQLVVLREFIGNRGIKFFSEDVLTQCSMLYPEWTDQKRDWINFVDPAGTQRTQGDEVTCVQHMAANGIKRIVPGEMTWEARRSAVEYFLTKISSDGPGVLIDSAGCPLLIRGFQGGYRYADNVTKLKTNFPDPVKDEHSHVHDGFQYLCSRARGMLGKSDRRRLPSPSYSFLKSELKVPEHLD